MNLRIAAAAAVAVFACALTSSQAATVTACTKLNLCYCINPANQAARDANVVRVRQLIAEQRKLGKAIGYLSIPLSTAGGSYFGLNQDIAKATAQQVTQRFGSNSVWVLNPGAEGNLPPGASGADYMYMWTQILEGPTGFGEDFDFFYFTGPADFGRFFSLTGNGDLDTLDAYFEKRRASDPDFQKAIDAGKVSKRGFRDYYGLRAAVTFSYGSHDEWNISHILNDRRRGATALGLANQIAVFFDGHPVSPSEYEGLVATGDTGRCIN